MDEPGHERKDKTMIDPLTEEQEAKAVDRFGGCPVCHDYDCCVNVGRSHWFICREHKKKWCVGSNLFSGWRHESEEDWRKNAAEIADFEEVESWHPRGERSEPSKGDDVRIFWLWDSSRENQCCKEGSWDWRGSKGEDFARSVSPIVVKAKPTVSKYELACRLRRLASAVEAGELFPIIEVPA